MSQAFFDSEAAYQEVLSRCREEKELRNLGHFIRQEMTITRYLAFDITRFDERGLAFTAPLAANVNHQGTVFGGSLNMMAVLSAWSMVNLLCKNMGLKAEVVIQKNTIEYRKPVYKDFEAICLIPSFDEVSAFANMLNRRKVGRLNVTSIVESEGECAVHFEGRFVATR